MTNTKIHDIDLVIFDTETTGLEPSSGDRIVEIAGIRMKAGVQTGEFESFINPEGRTVCEAAYRVNNISPEMLQGAPLSTEVIPRFMEFCGGAYLASYNTRFDLKFLNSEAKKSGVEIPRDLCAIDILGMARTMLPGLGSYALENVVSCLGIASSQAHRAMQDVKLAQAVFEKIKTVLKEKSIDDMDYVINLFASTSSAACCMKEEIYLNIEKAIVNKSKVNIKYMSRIDGKVSERVITPLEITRDQYRRYLVGFCYMRNEKRTFNIDGILRLETSE